METALPCSAINSILKVVDDRTRGFRESLCFPFDTAKRCKRQYQYLQDPDVVNLLTDCRTNASFRNILKHRSQWVGAFNAVHIGC